MRYNDKQRGVLSMALQNRVTAFGDIVANSARGQMMGNRGGRIHERDQTLSTRRWASAAWIICVLEFKQRHRQIMAPNRYTELFFLDEVTALAAGHRPCFECRRTAATDFATRWGQTAGMGQRASAGDMDRQLHLERVFEQKTKQYKCRDISSLPDGTMIIWKGQPAALKDNQLLAWTIEGYERPVERPIGIDVDVLTPSCTVAVLKLGYQPQFHWSHHGS
jgi:hypothetical protein